MDFGFVLGPAVDDEVVTENRPEQAALFGMPAASFDSRQRTQAPRKGQTHAVGNAPFADVLLGWKKSTKNKLKWTEVPNCADGDSAESLRIAAGMLEELSIRRDSTVKVPPDPGGPLEEHVRDHLKETMGEDRLWSVDRGRIISSFHQYRHLEELHALVRNEPELRVTIGLDYLIKPDVTVGVASSPDIAEPPFLHAAVSCKWTIRSDRVQNIRHECLQMIRHRRGRQPHLVTVTAEPLPSRLAAIARGTGEVDAVYHVAFSALAQAVERHANDEQRDAWNECVGQRRLLDYTRLPETLRTY